MCRANVDPFRPGGRIILSVTRPRVWHARSLPPWRKPMSSGWSSRPRPPSMERPRWCPFRRTRPLLPSALMASQKSDGAVVRQGITSTSDSLSNFVRTSGGLKAKYLPVRLFVLSKNTYCTKPPVPLDHRAAVRFAIFAQKSAFECPRRTSDNHHVFAVIKLQVTQSFASG
jgi:hypothetical protein